MEIQKMGKRRKVVMAEKAAEDGRYRRRKDELLWEVVGSVAAPLSQQDMAPEVGKEKPTSLLTAPQSTLLQGKISS